MAMNEKAIIEVSESHTAVVDGDTIVVKEAEMAPLPVQPPPMEPQPTNLPIDPVSPPEDEERKVRTESADDKPKGWMGSQNAKDFAPFLVMEMKRIKPPSSCIGRHNETERALGQSKKLNSFISKALQSDWDGAIPIDAIDRMRQQLEQNIEALTRMLEAHQNMKKHRRQVRRRASNESVCPSCTAPLWEEGEDMVCLACGQEGLKKEAGTPNFCGIQIQISAFENAVTGMMINAVVANGRNLEELYDKLKAKYGFTDREELAILQIMEDKGYPVFKDRARVGEDEDPTDSDEPREWQTQYHA
jgi:hypothetical protein